MIEKGLAVAVILLFIGMCIVPSTAIQELKEKPSPISFDGDTLYVGGSGPNNYTRIQDAIDNASDGDTVFVYSGIYSDFFPEIWACVRISKRIQLLGEDRATTIINGTGFDRVVVVAHETEGVEISGFTIQHGVELNSSDWALGIDVSNHIEVHNNIITNTNKGIYINQQYTDILVYDNIIINNKNGIEAESNDRSFIEIFNNTISDNECGFYCAHNNEVSVYDNLITNNSVGIYMSQGESNNVIYHNHIIDNSIGISIATSRSTTIQENNFINNEKHATLLKRTILLTIPIVPLYRQRWTKNYWDNWDATKPHPVNGLIIFYFNIVIPIKPFFITIPIGLLPYVEFDWHPAQEPYDI